MNEFKAEREGPSSPRDPYTSYENPSYDNGDGASSARSVRDDATEAARRSASAAADAARDLREEGRRAANEVAQQAGELGRQYLEEAARQLAGFANALDAAADRLRDQNQNEVAMRTAQVADGLDEFAQKVSRQDLGSLLDTATGWAKENPAGFIGGAVAVGFALSRFLKAAEPSEDESMFAEPPELPPTDDELRPTASSPYPSEPTY